MILWRISRHRDLSGAGGLKVSGRWHYAGQPIVYLAGSPPAALLEVCVHTSASDVPPEFTLLRINAAPFYGQVSYGGGKLGVYSYWNTVGAVSNNNSANLIGINNNSTAPNEYEFYNYSWSKGSPNANETGNQYNNSTLSGPYYTDFFTSNVQNELYNLNTGGSNSNSIQQVQQAIQTAFSNYITYLECTSQMTGSNGLQASGYNNSYCPANNQYQP